MKICVFGNKKTTSGLLRHLHTSGFEVSALVTLNKAAQSRVDISGADDALTATAADLGVALLLAEKYNLSTPHDRQMFENNSFDIGLCTGWQRLIPDSILRQFRYGVFGWHGSGFRFPNGRGRSPLNWSLRLGLDVVYHNCFQYAAGVDDGRVYETAELPVTRDTYIADLQTQALDHIMASSLRLLKDAAGGDVPLRPQIDHPFITFPALNEASGFLSLPLLTAEEARNITRSCSRPFPGAFVRLRDSGETLRIWRLSAPGATDRQPQLSPGEAVCGNGRLWLGFRDGILVSDDFEVAGPAPSHRVLNGPLLHCE